MSHKVLSTKDSFHIPMCVHVCALGNQRTTYNLGEDGWDFPVRVEVLQGDEPAMQEEGAHEVGTAEVKEQTLPATKITIRNDNNAHFTCTLSHPLTSRG